MTIEQLDACAIKDTTELYNQLLLKAKLKSFPKRDKHRKEFFKRLNEANQQVLTKEEIRQIYKD